MTFDIIRFKNNLEKLHMKSESREGDYNEEKTFHEFVKPFFEELEWNFETDVKKTDTSKVYRAFKIDDVTKFYLSTYSIDETLDTRRDENFEFCKFTFNKGVTWAIATNFKEIRVYNVEETNATSLASMAYFTLKASDYVTYFEKLLDLTKHQFNRDTMQKDVEFLGKVPKRVSIDKQLLSDLLSFRNSLVENILKNNSKINEETSENASQMILNRLIFMRSCGDRKIEERILKQLLAEWMNDKSESLIHRLQKEFSYFKGTYGGTLFEDHICDKLVIDDDILEIIIDGLYQSKKKAMEYDFALIEHDTLGKMYENYLGNIQQKEDGAYYTPTHISKYICENTIIRYLSKSNSTTYSELISEYSNNLEELEEKIHNLKIIDPACGTGEFLIRAINVILKISKRIQHQKEQTGAYTKIEGNKKHHKNEGTITQKTLDKDLENEELRDIIKNNIFGVDLNHEAIEITRLNLFLKLATVREKLGSIENVFGGDSLFDDKKGSFDWKKKFPKQFDIVIGNPPYFNIDSKSRLKKISDYQTLSKGILNIASLFVKTGIDLLKNNGYFGMIIPKGFLYVESWSKIRKFVLSKKLVIACDVGKAFDEVNLEQTIIVIEKNKNTDNFVLTTNKKFEKINEIKQVDFIETNKIQTCIGKNVYPIIKKIESNSKKLSEISKMPRGMTVNSKYYSNTEEGNVLVLGGVHLLQYGLKKGTRKDKQFLSPNDQKIKDKTDIFSHKRIIYQNIATSGTPIVATIVPSDKVTDDTVNNLILKEKSLSYEELLGILNSKLLSFYLTHNVINCARLTIHLDTPYLGQLPITNNRDSKLKENVTKLLSIIEKNPFDEEIEIFKEKINKIIYHMYGINENEIKLIEAE